MHVWLDKLFDNVKPKNLDNDRIIKLQNVLLAFAVQDNSGKCLKSVYEKLLFLLQSVDSSSFLCQEYLSAISYTLITEKSLDPSLQETIISILSHIFPKLTCVKNISEELCQDFANPFCYVIDSLENCDSNLRRIILKCLMGLENAILIDKTFPGFSSQILKVILAKRQLNIRLEIFQVWLTYFRILVDSNCPESLESLVQHIHPIFDRILLIISEESGLIPSHMEEQMKLILEKLPDSIFKSPHILSLVGLAQLSTLDVTLQCSEPLEILYCNLVQSVCKMNPNNESNIQIALYQLTCFTQKVSTRFLVTLVKEFGRQLFCHLATFGKSDLEKPMLLAQSNKSPIDILVENFLASLIKRGRMISDFLINHLIPQEIKQVQDQIAFLNISKTVIRFHLENWSQSQSDVVEFITDSLGFVDFEKLNSFTKAEDSDNKMNQIRIDIIVVLFERIGSNFIAIPECKRLIFYLIYQMEARNVSLRNTAIIAFYNCFKISNQKELTEFIDQFSNDVIAQVSLYLQQVSIFTSKQQANVQLTPIDLYNDVEYTPKNLRTIQSSPFDSGNKVDVDDPLVYRMISLQEVETLNFRERGEILTKVYALSQLIYNPVHILQSCSLFVPKEHADQTRKHLVENSNEIIVKLKPVIDSLLSCLDLLFECHSKLILNIFIGILSLQNSSDQSTGVVKTHESLPESLTSVCFKRIFSQRESFRYSIDFESNQFTFIRPTEEETKDESHLDTTTTIPIHDSFHAIEKILIRSCHLTSHHDPTVRYNSILIFNLVLKSRIHHEERILLPSVHKLWPSLVYRFLDNCIEIVEICYETFLEITRRCGDFVRNRSLTDLFQNISLFLQRASTLENLVSINSKSKSKKISVFKRLLGTIGEICVNLKLNSDVIQPICETIMKMKDNQLCIELKMEIDKTIGILRDYDPGLFIYLFNNKVIN